MAETVDLKGILKQEDFQILEALVKAVMLDPSEEVRKTAINIISRRYGGVITEGFCGDNQLFVIFGKNGVGKIGYVCDKPKEYLKMPTVVYPFRIEAK